MGDGGSLYGNTLQALKSGLTSRNDIKLVTKLCHEVAGIEGLEELRDVFYKEVCRASTRVPEKIINRDAALPSDWFTRPWYCAYVQYTGTNDISANGTFENLQRMLPTIQHLGFENICLLPHYESPMADGGYDISSFRVRESLGGDEAFQKFMKEAIEMGICVATDAVFNHTSTKHDWFQRAISGDPHYMRYYLQRNGREKVAETEVDGSVVCSYRDQDGTVTNRVAIFPHLDRTHGLWVKINSAMHQFYRTFLPVQVDLNLRNPTVLGALFYVLVEEIATGILAKRMDAVAHWIKKPGYASEGLPETHSLQALFKTFLRHISSRAVIIPEVVQSAQVVASYTGISTVINGAQCPSEGDAVFSFEMQASLRETLFLETIAPFWRTVIAKPNLPSSAVWLNLLDHHDEVFLGFFSPKIRRWVQDFLRAHNGVIFRNGLSAGARYADCLSGNPARISTAIFLLYMCPGSPFVYSGVEIGFGNHPDHAFRQMLHLHKTFQNLGINVEKESCFDPRELHRGPMPMNLFKKARDDRYLPFVTLKRLNELRRSYISMQSEDLYPVDAGSVSILCLTRESRACVPLLCVANLSSKRNKLVIPCWQLAERMRINPPNYVQGPSRCLAFRNLINEAILSATVENDNFVLHLDAFDRAVLVTDSSTSVGKTLTKCI